MCGNVKIVVNNAKKVKHSVMIVYGWRIWTTDSPTKCKIGIGSGIVPNGMILTQIVRKKSSLPLDNDDKYSIMEAQ